MKEYVLMFHDKFSMEDFDADISISVRLGQEHTQRGSTYILPQKLFDQVLNWAALTTWDSSFDEPTLQVYNIHSRHKSAFENMVKI